MRPAEKFIMVRSLPIKNPVKEHLFIEKSCQVQVNLISCPLLKRTEAALRRA